MRALRITTIIITILSFFLTVRVLTREEILTEPIIDSDQINAAIEQVKKSVRSRNESFDTQKEWIVYDVINMEISQRAMEVEAEKRGIKVNKEDVQNFIEEQVTMYTQLADEDDYFADHLQKSNLTVEEYIMNMGYEQIESQILHRKLYESLAIHNNRTEDDPYQAIEENFREAYKDQIERLKRKYGVLDVKEDQMYYSKSN